MHHRNEPSGTRGRLRTAALLPAVVVAWMTLGTGAAMAAPGGHAAVTAAATAMPTDAGQANGKANGQTNGKANGQDNGKANRKADATTSSGTASGGSSDHSSGNAGTSGAPSQPQPVSNADQNSGGANGKCPGGPYCSTRDGSPSGNGNGGGKATGKPCAGCVGKADNKNPKGQYPNGSDHNAGYECDRNHGVGRTNPAHTGCTSTTPECDETTEDCGGSGGCDTATEDCGGGDCDTATEDCGGGDCDTATEDCGGGDCDTATEDCGGGDCDTATEDCGGGDCDTATEDCGGGDCETATEDCGGGDCDTATEDCGGGDCDTATEDCGGGDCDTATEDCGNPPPACTPTEANNFCSDVESEHHTRKPPTDVPPTTVLGEKVTRTPSVLPFTGATGI